MLPENSLCHAGNAREGLQAGLSTSAQKRTKFREAEWAGHETPRALPLDSQAPNTHREVTGPPWAPRLAPQQLELVPVWAVGLNLSQAQGWVTPTGASLLPGEIKSQREHPKSSIPWELRDAGHGTILLLDKSFPFHAKEIQTIT